MTNKLHPLFKWFGSSYSSAKHYPAPLAGSTIYEPFAGSAGYSLNHYKHDVVLWDSNPLLQQLWVWIIEVATTDMVLEIPLDLPVGTDITTLGLSRGQQLLLKHWQRTNNVGPCMTISPWGNKSGQWVKNCRTRVSQEIHAVKHWKFQPMDWTLPGTWLVDPPYFYNYKYGVKNFDYSDLAKKVLALPPQSMAICSEAVCPKTHKVPDYLPFTPSHSQVTSRRKTTNNHHSKELVYLHKT